MKQHPEILAANLNAALAAAHPFVPRKPAIIGLGHFLLEMRPDGKGTISATDTADWVSVKVGYPSFEGPPIHFTVPARPLYDMGRMFPEDDTVALRRETGAVRLAWVRPVGDDGRTGMQRLGAAFKGLDGADFYPVEAFCAANEDPDADEALEAGAVLRVRALRDASGVVNFVAGPDRPQLERVHIEFTPTGLRFTATDGYAVAVVQVPAEFDIQSRYYGQTVDVHHTFLRKLNGLGENQLVRLAVLRNAHDRRILRLDGDYLWTATTQIGDDYPDVQAAIEAQINAPAAVVSAPLPDWQRAVRAARVFGEHLVLESENEPGLLHDARLKISAINPELGGGRQVLDVQVGEAHSSPINVALGANLLKNALDLFARDDVVTLVFSGANTAVLLHNADKHVQAVIMPLMRD